MRQVFANELSCDPRIEVVGVAPDPYVARHRIIKLTPGILTPDIEMARMNGIVFLRKLVRRYPLPVMVVSCLTPKEGARALDILDPVWADAVVSQEAGPGRPVPRPARGLRRREGDGEARRTETACLRTIGLESSMLRLSLSRTLP